VLQTLNQLIIIILTQNEACKMRQNVLQVHYYLFDLDLLDTPRSSKEFFSRLLSYFSLRLFYL